MKVAIAKEGDMVSEHFGHCTEYAVFVIEKSKITSREILESPGHEPGKLPPFLASHKVTHVLAGGMGPRAVDLFCENNIEVFLGVRGKIETIITDFIAGKIAQGESSLYPRPRSRMQWTLTLVYGRAHFPEDMITTNFTEMRDRKYKNRVKCHYEKISGYPRTARSIYGGECG